MCDCYKRGPGQKPLLFCGVPPREQSPLEPSIAHAAAEEQFRCAIVQNAYAACMEGSEEGLCEWVSSMDKLVQSGSVRRRAAGVMASMFLCDVLVMGMRHHCTLLYVVLFHGVRDRIHDGCLCLRTVLNWGACPSVLCAPTPTHMTYYPAYEYAGAELVVRERLQTELLAYGSAPWNRYSLLWTATSAYVVTVDSRPVGRAGQQWWQWHARWSRVQWVKWAQVGCGGGTSDK